MADKTVQLHKKGNVDELWYPKTKSGCVNMTDYVKDTTMSGDIQTTDNLNTALNRVLSSVSKVYTPHGNITASQISGNDHQYLKSFDIGYVFNASENFTTDNKFVEGAGKNFAAGTNIVIVPETSTGAGVQGKMWDVLGTFFPVFTGATSSASGAVGLVPAPTTAQRGYYLKGDGTWSEVSSGGGSGTVTPSGSGDTGCVAYYESANSNTIKALPKLKYSVTSGGTGQLTMTGFLNTSGKLTVEGGGANITGNLAVTGTITGVSSTSDKRLKTNVQPFRAFDIVDKLKPVQFEWNETACEYNDNLDKSINYGLIAQDSENVMDGLVFDLPDESGYKGVRYEKLIPVLLQAVKELQQEVNELKSRL